MDEFFVCSFEGTIYLQYGPVAQLVRAPPCHGGGREFESLLGRCGVLAQLGEHLPYKQRVTGSSPVTPTFLWTGIVLRISGDDALRGHTRSHSEHDG